MRKRTVSGGAFSLFDGDVNEFERSGAIASGKDMRRGRLLMEVNCDGIVFEFDARFLKSQAEYLGFASERIENRGRLDGFFGPFVLEDDTSCFFVALNAKEFRLLEDLYAPLAKGVFHDFGNVLVHAFEQVCATLHNSDTRSQRIEVMGQLKGDGPRAKNDDRLRNVREIKDIVAGQASGAGQAWNIWSADHGTRYDRKDSR